MNVVDSSGWLEYFANGLRNPNGVETFSPRLLYSATWEEAASVIRSNPNGVVAQSHTKRSCHST